MKGFLLFLTFMAIHNSALTQHNYYFSDKANKEGTGSLTDPFASLQKISTISLKPGDTVFFRGSDTIQGSILISSIAGTKEHPVVFTSYGNGPAVVNGNKNEAMVISGSEYFQIIRLNFTGAGRKTGNSTNGVKLEGCSHFAISNLEIAGFQKSGLLLFNCSKGEVSGVFAHENGLAGILVEGYYQKRISRDIHIFNCRADNNPGDPTNLGNHSGNGILVGNCRNVLIEYCTATNNGWDMPRIGNGPVGIWAYEADSVIIQNCISYRNKTAPGAADGGGFDLDGGVTNSIIQYCLSYENQGSGYGIFQYYGAGKWNNNTLRFCTSINDGKITEHASGMYIWNGWNGDSTFTGFRAYQNLFYNDTKYAFSFSELSRHREFSFYNNIFIAADTAELFNGVDSSTNDLFLGNVWTKVNGGFRQHGFRSFEQWIASTGYEQYKGRPTGTSFQQKLFSIPGQLDITDPFKLKTNGLLLGLCNPTLLIKGINITKLFGIDPGRFDFFGHPLHSGKTPVPGICAGR